MALLRKLTIRSQLTLIALALALIVLIILSASYLQMAKIIQSNNNKATSDLILQMKQTIYANKDVLERLMTNIAFNADVQSFLLEEDKVQRFLLSKRVESLLVNTRTLKEGILDILLLGHEGRWMDIGGGRRLTTPYQGRLTDEGAFQYYTVQDAGDQYSTTSLFLIGVNIKYAQPGERFNASIGTLFFVVSPKALMGGISSISQEMNSQAFFMDQEDRVIASGDTAGLEKELEELYTQRALTNHDEQELQWDGRTYMAKGEYLPELKSSIVSIIPKDVLMRDLNFIRIFFSIIFVLGGIVMLVLFAILTNNILLPLKKLMMYMNTIKHGNLDKLKHGIDLDGYVEITVMANEFNKMMNQIDMLTKELLDANTALLGAELERKQAELSYLRSQINPHFLYNTLEMIKGMAAVKGAQEIRASAAALASIFRYSIKGDGMVPLQTELSIIESYLHIQRLRFGSRFHVELDAEEAALDCLVPKMILQPIVENAVYHGLELKEKQGLLRIQAVKSTADDLILIVEDDGVGMEPDRLEWLKSMLLESPQDLLSGKGKGSIGFANVNARIKLMYGSKYGLAVRSVAGKGTWVQLTLSAKAGVHHEDKSIAGR
ncbi:cache domain-containing sensor histidine kinase [Paenibacillus aquistagni]|uniref:Two-component system, sensor histidine kinase YesM n=1 Tax=Paenibacillus aquistagni TaxID=1852522 RepID=A0A1X7LP97_9BACL|nr:sensor histidine kinase [Paenibacillus aquistagni]SMG55698.1 two-component system, sensor histidine kinase YesM [Paenibacillus aquistagni]